MLAPKITLYTLSVDNYAPDVTALTFPLMKRWAEKLGADFHVITERRWPDYPPVYEKLQLYDLTRARNDDWSIYLDADALVHPDTFNPTNHLSPDTVCFNGMDLATNRWRYDAAGYFQRDGRHIGACNWLAIASRWCRDLWRPMDDMTYEEAVEHIYPTQFELNSGVVQRSHLIDDYILSRNIARFGLKHTTLLAMQSKLGDGSATLWHQYTIPIQAKIHGYTKPGGDHEPGMLDILRIWGVTP